MNMLLPIIVLIILTVVYAGSLNNSRSRLCVVTSVLFFILLLCWMQLYSNNSYNSNNSNNSNNSYNSNMVNHKENFKNINYAPVNYKLGINNNSSKTTSCDNLNFMNINNQISPLGSYDGIKLYGKMTSSPLLDKVFMSNPDGDDTLLTEDLNSKNYPTVDGSLNGFKSLFVFAHNKADINCKSQYSTSTGQVCLSPEQIKMFSGSGADYNA